MAKALTAVQVEQAKPSAKRIELRDGLTPGMSLIIQPSGKKSWALRYWHEGKFFKHTLGGFPAVGLAAARDLARDARKKVASGVNPVIEKRLAASGAGKPDFVETVWADFLKRHLEVKAKPSSVAKFKRILEKQVLPKWKGRRIDSIAKRDVLALVDEVTKRGPHAANSLITVLSSFFGWCVSRDIVAINPMQGVKKTAETSRERTLADNELKQIWEGCEKPKVNPAYGAFVRLLILSGCRRSEIANLEWSEVDTAARIMTIPGGPNGRTKNGQEHRIYLTDSMLTIIAKMPRIKKCKFIFTTDGASPISGFSKMKTILDTAAPVADWTLHDTRRTIASGLARMGVALTTIERVLNHQSDSFSPLVRTYQRHDFAAEMQKAWELWSDHVAAVIAGKASNVVPMRTPEAVG
jgi:integrase